MPRNSSGTYSLPESAFVPSTPISSTAVNSDFDDIADALTDSLSRTGDGGMQAVLPLNSLGFTYQGDSDTGMSRSGANTQAITCGGTAIVELSATDVAVNGDLEVTGDLTSGGASILLVGEVKIWPSATIPSKWLLMDGSSLLRATYPALWTFAAAEISAGNTLFTNGNGTTTFTVGTMVGYAPVGVDAASTTLPSVTHIGDTTGNKTATLIGANLPAYTPSGTISGGVSSIFQNITSPAVGATHMVIAAASGDGATGAGNTLSATFTGAAQGGVSTPVAIVQPSRAFNFIIYAGA